MRSIRCFRHSQRLALYQGTIFSRAVKAQTKLDFGPVLFSGQIRVLLGVLRGKIYQSSLPAHFAGAGAKGASFKQGLPVQSPPGRPNFRGVQISCFVDFVALISLDKRMSYQAFRNEAGLATV